MKNLSLRSEFYIPRLPSNPSCSSSSNPPPFVKSIKVVVSYGEKDLKLRNPPSEFAINRLRENKTTTSPVILKHTTVKQEQSCQRPLLKLLVPENGYSRDVIVGAVSLGIMMVLLSGLDEQKALALGPEGPLVEEFWDNVRRYALYALTVSTGAIYTIVQPIFELLKNPISAILIIAILGGSIYIVSQVLSAMVGVTDFTYNYG